MQSATDTDKRMVTHLEGKLHQGFAKIRKVLNELKQKKEEYKKQKAREGRYDRTPSPRVNRNRKEEADPIDVVGGVRGLFSSKLYGSGTNMPDTYLTKSKYANAALAYNKNSVGVPVVAPDFKQIFSAKEARRIAWEKEHGYVDGKPPKGMGFEGRGRGRGRGGVGFRGGDRRDRGGFERGGFDRGGYDRGGNDRFDDRRRDRAPGGFDRDRRRY